MSTINPTTFAAAVAYAAGAHADQTRKRADDDTRPPIPYISHLLGVAAIVIEDVGTEQEAIAGLLHDLLEDQDRAGRAAEIESKFGVGVLEIVRACSGPKKEDAGMADFRVRKQIYLEHLAAETNPSAIKVSLADKVHNARSTVNDLEADGAIMWKRFNSTHPSDQLWWYGRLAGHYLDHAQHGRASLPRAQELDRLAAQMRALTPAE